MRRLRFPEISELIRRDAEAHGRWSAYYIDHMAHWSSINHAYLDEVWECAGRYEFYRHELAGGSPDAEPSAAADPGRM
jgi:hypothetical protein